MSSANHTALVNTPIAPVLTPPAPVCSIHITNSESTAPYDKPLVPAVTTLKSDCTLSNINVQLTTYINGVKLEVGSH